MPFKNFPHKKKLKREEAAARKADHEKLTPEQVLAKLDLLFGVGKGASKQRARLKKKPKVVETQPEVKADEKEVKPKAKRSAAKTTKTKKS